MPRRVLTDPDIVKHARRAYRFFLDAGDNPDSALHKGIAATLANRWTKGRFDVTSPRGLVHYGEQYAALQALVTAPDGENQCS